MSRFSNIWENKEERERIGQGFQPWGEEKERGGGLVRVSSMGEEEKESEG